MLSDFVAANHDLVVDLARARVAKRAAPRPTDEELARGIPLFVDQLVQVLRVRSGDGTLEASAAIHGADLLRSGFTIAQVVHDYGDVCQVITQLAIDQEAAISAAEFQQLNKCLDDAIAEAVTENSRIREGSIAHDETERLGYLAHELRNKINAASMAFGILKDGRVAVGGSTGAVLERNLHGLQDLITRSLAEVRVDSGVQHRERLKVRHLVEEVEVEGSMLADRRGVHFTVTEFPRDLVIDADRALLAAALMNLLTNAFKFTPPEGNVWLRTTSTRDHVTFEVEDECGGLPTTDANTLFKPWTQRSSDKRGLGLGLPLVRRSIQAIGGDVKVTDKPGKGCVFAIRVLRVADRTVPAADGAASVPIESVPPPAPVAA
jgi:signal transduction histidine kinase